MNETVRHFSIDNETLDTVATAHLLSIGIACHYNGETHSMIVYPAWADQEAMGRTKSDETLAWWNKQDPALKGATFATAQASTMSPAECLHQINRFILEHSRSADEVRIWGNGSEFDIAQIELLSRQCEVKPIWSYYLVDSQRTIQRISQWIGIPYNKNEFFDPGDKKHDAEADARAQVRLINHLWERLGEKRAI